MRDALLEWGLRVGVVGGFSHVVYRMGGSAWQLLCRFILATKEPELYARMKQAYEWERDRNVLLESRIDRLTKTTDPLPDSLPATPSPESTSTE